MTTSFSNDNLEDFRGFLRNCLAGDSKSILRFQDRFGEDIYNFPVKARHMNMDWAADFYCYCFEKNRIFKRLLTFKGLCALRTYQFRILNDLFNEWSREEARQAISTEPLDSGKDFLGIDLLDSFSVSFTEYNTLLDNLILEEQVYIKLLSYHEFGLDPGDLRMISEISKRPINEVMDSFIEIDQKLAERDEEYAERQVKLDELEGRILELERGKKKLAYKKEDPEENPDQEWMELNRKLEWRRRQKEELLRKYNKVKCQLSYRDIADLLNVSLGKVSEKINDIKKKISGLSNGTIKADSK